MRLDETTEAAARPCIVLTSQLVENADGFEIHGIFPSFNSAALHISKDADLGAVAESKLLRAWTRPGNLHEYVGPGNDGRATHWCASIQPVRCADGCTDLLTPQVPVHATLADRGGAL